MERFFYIYKYRNTIKSRRRTSYGKIKVIHHMEALFSHTSKWDQKKKKIMHNREKY
jgi:hypothetical protein